MKFFRIAAVAIACATVARGAEKCAAALTIAAPGGADSITSAIREAGRFMGGLPEAMSIVSAVETELDGGFCWVDRKAPLAAALVPADSGFDFVLFLPVAGRDFKSAESALGSFRGKPFKKTGLSAGMLDFEYAVKFRGRGGAPYIALCQNRMPPQGLRRIATGAVSSAPAGTLLRIESSNPAALIPEIEEPEDVPQLTPRVYEATAIYDSLDIEKLSFAEMAELEETRRDMLDEVGKAMDYAARTRALLGQTDRISLDIRLFRESGLAAFLECSAEKGSALETALSSMPRLFDGLEAFLSQMRANPRTAMFLAAVSEGRVAKALGLPAKETEADEASLLLGAKSVVAAFIAGAGVEEPDPDCAALRRKAIESLAAGYVTTTEIYSFSLDTDGSGIRYRNVYAPASKTPVQEVSADIEAFAAMSVFANAAKPGAVEYSSVPGKSFTYRTRPLEAGCPLHLGMRTSAVFAAGADGVWEHIELAGPRFTSSEWGAVLAGSGEPADIAGKMKSLLPRFAAESDPLPLAAWYSSTDNLAAALAARSKGALAHSELLQSISPAFAENGTGAGAAAVWCAGGRLRAELAIQPAELSRCAKMMPAADAFVVLLASSMAPYAGGFALPELRSPAPGSGEAPEEPDPAESPDAAPGEPVAPEAPETPETPEAPEAPEASAVAPAAAGEL